MSNVDIRKHNTGVTEKKTSAVYVTVHSYFTLFYGRRTFCSNCANGDRGVHVTVAAISRSLCFSNNASEYEGRGVLLDPEYTERRIARHGRFIESATHKPSGLAFKTNHVQSPSILL